MLWFWLFGTIAVIGAVVVGVKEREIFLVFIGSLFGLAMSLCVALLFNCIFNPIVPRAYPSHSVDLQNIRDTMSTQGSFFLGSGTIDSKPVFEYYEKTGPGSFDLQTVDASITTVHESKNVRPHITLIYSKSSNRWLTLFPGTSLKHVDIYVPPNSVVQDYKLGQH